MNIIDRAAEILGSRTKLAETFGVSRSCVSQWDRRKRIPADKVLRFEEITGISRHVLRPDVFGEAP